MKVIIESCSFVNGPNDKALFEVTGEETILEILEFARDFLQQNKNLKSDILLQNILHALIYAHNHNHRHLYNEPVKNNYWIQKLQHYTCFFDGSHESPKLIVEAFEA